METKEIAMSKLTRWMGTACVLAMGALTTVGPAAADPITAPAFTVSTGYARLDDGQTANEWFLGGAIGGPLGFEGLSLQADLQMGEVWGDGFSAIDWTGGGDAFWGGADGRFGVDAHGAHFHANGANTNDSNVGFFGEYYINNFTVGAKGGWSFPTGGHGNYLGADVTGYFIPDLAISGSFGWYDAVLSDRTFSPVRFDSRDNILSITAEYFLADTIGFPLSVWGGFSVDWFHVSSGVEGVEGFSDHDTIWTIGLKWYTGGGSLMDHHRQGLLRPWLKGQDWLDGIPN
jgi:hypothetical protein